RWLGGLADRDNSKYNWIASGKDGSDYAYVNGGEVDGTQIWEKLLGGTWAPYKFTSRDSTVNGPAFDNNTVTFANKFNEQSSVDIVFTPDQRYWSKCLVIEEQFKKAKAIGQAGKCTPRKSPSKDVNGNVIPGDTSFSYFPGYAINVETGERLNIAFGEDSYECPD